jgi:hypothetical protein
LTIKTIIVTIKYSPTTSADTYEDSTNDTTKLAEAASAATATNKSTSSKKKKSGKGKGRR